MEVEGNFGEDGYVYSLDGFMGTAFYMSIIPQ